MVFRSIACILVIVMSLGGALGQQLIGAGQALDEVRSMYDVDEVDHYSTRLFEAVFSDVQWDEKLQALPVDSAARPPKEELALICGLWEVDCAFQSKDQMRSRLAGCSQLQLIHVLAHLVEEAARDDSFVPLIECTQSRLLEKAIELDDESLMAVLECYSSETLIQLFCSLARHEALVCKQCVMEDNAYAQLFVYVKQAVLKIPSSYHDDGELTFALQTVSTQVLVDLLIYLVAKICKKEGEGSWKLFTRRVQGVLKNRGVITWEGRDILIESIDASSLGSRLVKAYLVFYFYPKIASRWSCSQPHCAVHYEGATESAYSYGSRQRGKLSKKSIQLVQREVQGHLNKIGVQKQFNEVDAYIVFGSTGRILLIMVL